MWALLERLQVDIVAEVRAQLERGQQHRVLLGHRVHPAHHVVDGLQGGGGGQSLRSGLCQSTETAWTLKLELLKANCQSLSGRFSREPGRPDGFEARLRRRQVTVSALLDMRARRSFNPVTSLPLVRVSYLVQKLQ